METITLTSEPGTTLVPAGGDWSTTVPAWASFATGAFPDGHGCYDHVAPDRDGRMRVVRGGDLRRPTYYEQLGREGRRSVLVNLPIDQNGCDSGINTATEGANRLT